MTKSSPRSGQSKPTEEGAAAETKKSAEPLETPISVQTKAQESADAAATSTSTSGQEAPRDVLAKLPYPHDRLVIPQAVPTGDGARVDLVITRQWTPVPGPLVQRVKDTARRARIVLDLAVPTNDNNQGV